MGLITTNELGALGFSIWDVYERPWDTPEEAAAKARQRAWRLQRERRLAREAWERREAEAQARFARRRYRSLAHRRMAVAEKIRQDNAELRRQVEVRARQAEVLRRRAELQRSLTALRAEIDFKRQRAAQARAGTSLVSAAPSTHGVRGGRLIAAVPRAGGSVSLAWPRPPTPIIPATYFDRPRYPTPATAAPPPATTYAGAFK
jgi:hypothetical protein